MGLPVHTAERTAEVLTQFRSDYANPAIHLVCKDWNEARGFCVQEATVLIDTIPGIGPSTQKPHAAPALR